MEAGYTEKVDELCDRYSLKGFLNVKGTAKFCHYSPSSCAYLYGIILSCVDVWKVSVLTTYVFP